MSALPLAYFAVAFLSLGTALAVLIAWPWMPGGFFYHPKMIALTHLVTLGWLSGSIAGAAYIVCPLAFGSALPVGRGDWIAWASYVIGLVGMVAHFWIAELNGMAWSAAMVIGAVLWIGGRLARRVSRARLGLAVVLHVRLAFVNFALAACAGIAIGLGRTHGWLPVSPLAATYAHAHLATLGWVAMLAIGVAYRLLPMLIPSALPRDAAMWLSAVLLEAGILSVAAALLIDGAWLPAAALVVIGGIGIACFHLMRAARQRRPRPPQLPAVDWSLLQIGGAAVWLLVAVTSGLLLAFGATANGEWYVPSLWIYGAAGLLGWLSQIVAAFQGRLVPWYAWYWAAGRAGSPPERSVHALISPPLAALVFGAWTIGVPLLVTGVAFAHDVAVGAGASAVLLGLVAGATHIVVMFSRASPRLPFLASDARVPRVT